MKKLFFVLIILNLILLPNALAKQGHMKLLAVKETEKGYQGGVADLYLEIKPGSGRVFLETFPLTRTDTQMSTRFAKAIACDALEMGCDDVDFFYTITADSAIIAGPSAGSSIAVLTVAMLDNLDINENYAITGTINSGGLIGPVGGLKEKIESAKANGLVKVMIPAGEAIARMDNTTVDLKNLSKKLGIDIIETSTLSEAVKEFTGKEISRKFKNIEINPEYTNTMKSLARDLCDRSNKLKYDSKGLNFSINVSAFKASAENLTKRGKESFEKQIFYSSASYCFGANVDYSTLILISKNLSRADALKEIEKIRKSINEFLNRVDRQEKKTITDLEAYIVIKERLAESSVSADEALEILNRTNSTEKIARNIAYSSERINSANSWATFLGKGGKAFVLNSEVLKKSCQSKISEADEREQYVELYLPNSMDSIKKEISRASSELEKKNYELCLSMASKAKADVDVVLGVFGVDNSQFRNIVDRKLEIVKNNIARQSAKGVFPILGYSYYEYANSLKESDLFSSMLYSEYALELGNLDIYFKESDGKKKFIYNIDKSLAGVFILGILVGAAAASLIKRNVKTRKRLK